MHGLQRICKTYGGIKFKRQDGAIDEWVWDYEQDKPFLKSEIDAKRKAEIERKKWMRIRAAKQAEQQELQF